MSDITYKTKQRSVILQCLMDNCDRAFTIDELVDELKSSGEVVGRTTVYRYIDRLVQSGQVRKFLFDSTKSAAYQYINHHNDCLKHMHLKCIKCGKFVHLGCDYMNDVCAHIRNDHGFIVDNSKTTILGVCADCAKSGEKECH